ncbi:MAG: 2Fe-2S iron-sulfur cluster-binding protein [Treponema sp.]|nr:2Fe-2S iron-sulfur cluster-binding protein [Treponema sp.]
MNVGFILNGEDVVVRCPAMARLIDILRADFGLMGTKSGCLAGKCGLCTVIFNGSVCPACLIPAFRLQKSEVITMEGFSLTDEYQDIESGFAEAGLDDCGYCRTGKTLIAGALLGRSKRPSRDEILRTVDGIRCRCTDPERLVEGIEKALETKMRRLYGRPS